MTTPNIDYDEDESLERSFEYGEVLFGEFEEVVEEDAEEEGIDPGAVYFGVFIRMIHYLVEMGWTAEQLREEIDYHVAMEKRHINVREGGGNA